MVCTSLAFARMPRVAARGGMATGDRGVARRAKTGGFGAVPLGFARMPRAEAQGASLITAEGPERSRRDYLLFIESFATDSSPLPPHRGGGQALQRRVKVGVNSLSNCSNSTGTFYKPGYRFNMIGVRKHVHRLDFRDVVLLLH